MAADGFSRTSDRQRFGVVAVQNQAGAENALGGIAQANADNIPILVLPGGVPLDRIGIHTEHSGKYHRAEVARIHAVSSRGSRLLIETELTGPDQEVRFRHTLSRRWRISLKGGQSRSVTVRGFRFFSGEELLFPPLAPYRR